MNKAINIIASIWSKAIVDQFYEESAIFSMECVRMKRRKWRGRVRGLVFTLGRRFGLPPVDGPKLYIRKPTNPDEVGSEEVEA